MDMKNNFALFSCHNMRFEEDVKRDKWVDSMNEKIDSIQKNDIWGLVDIPKGEESIVFEVVYNTKFNEKS